jgi:hypothetical protein
MLSTRERQARREFRHKVSGTLSHPHCIREERLKHWKLMAAVVLLLPVAGVTFVTIVQFMGRALVQQAFWKSSELGFFLIGGMAWWAMFYGGVRLVGLYVWGHEASHAAVALLSGGKILGFQASASGGYVDTNKSNTWITLAPYLVPLYTLIVLFLGLGAGLLVEMRVAVPVELGLVAFAFKPVWIAAFGVGWTWFFHITYTIKTIRLEQGDLVRNGEFFSIVLIFLSNLLLLMGMFLLASPGPDLTVMDWFATWWHNASQAASALWTVATETI